MTFEEEEQEFERLRRKSVIQGRKIHLDKACYKTRFRTRKSFPSEEEIARTERLKRLDQLLMDGHLEVTKEKASDIDLKIAQVESLFVRPQASTSQVKQLTYEVENLEIKQEVKEIETYEHQLK